MSQKRTWRQFPESDIDGNSTVRKEQLQNSTAVGEKGRNTDYTKGRTTQNSITTRHKNPRNICYQEKWQME